MCLDGLSTTSGWPILTLLAVLVSAKFLNCLGERFEEKFEEFLLQWSCAFLDVIFLAINNGGKVSVMEGEFRKF